MEQEPGILRKSLLSLKKAPFPPVQSLLLVAYKHYILTIDRYFHQEGDCVVFDTQKGTATILHTGLRISERMDYSLCYWKDNIFVLYGGTINEQPGSRAFIQNMNIYFLYVIENDGQVSFTSESCNLTDPEGWDVDHSAHIYQDNMYIFGSETQSSHEVVKKFDLNERTWSKCQTIGDRPRPCNRPATVLLNGKIYFFGGSTPGFGPLGSQAKASGVRIREVRPEKALDLFMLDLEHMQWQKIIDDNFLDTGARTGCHAEVVGDKIYIEHIYFDEFFIYDPASNKVLRSEGLPPKENWRIRSFGDHSIVFRISQANSQIFIEYEDLVILPQPEKQEKKVSQHLPHAELLWKEKPFADVTFIVQNEEVSAHRVILLKCRYFQNMLKSGMIEATSQKINVPDISPTNFKAILEYIYCDKIAFTELLAMELIILADMFLLPDLKADCEKYLSEKLTITNFVGVMKVAQTADSEKLEKRVVSFLTTNIEKVEEEIDIHMIPQELLFKAIKSLKPLKK